MYQRPIQSSRRPTTWENAGARRATGPVPSRDDCYGTPAARGTASAPGRGADAGATSWSGRCCQVSRGEHKMYYRGAWTLLWVVVYPVHLTTPHEERVVAPHKTEAAS